MEPINFKPGSNLTFDSVIAIRDRLYQLISAKECKSFCLDLAEVMHCDSAGLALLLETKKLCKKHHTLFQIKGISPETLALAEFCGVTPILDTNYDQ